MELLQVGTTDVHLSRIGLGENVGGASLVLPDDVLGELEQLIPLGPLYQPAAS